jgi:D-alanine-D-alanine ligase
MRVLVLHSDIADDAPWDELDTIATAKAVAIALEERGHATRLAPFRSEIEAVRALISEWRADAVFNMVEAADGLGSLAPAAPAILEQVGIPFTGCRAAGMALAGDKPLTKRVLRASRLPTADWVEPPHWQGLDATETYVVKSASEDASLGLDDGAVVSGLDAVRARATYATSRHGGRWFAEAYLEGREFNVAVLEEGGSPRVLPIPEMRFEGWPVDRPRIVGYAAKWDDHSEESVRTVRVFGNDDGDFQLRQALSELARASWTLLGMRGFARIDFRLDANGAPNILEVNPNPCLDSNTGFAVAAKQAGMSYPEVIERILRSAFS